MKSSCTDTACFLFASVKLRAFCFDCRINFKMSFKTKVITKINKEKILQITWIYDKDSHQTVIYSCVLS